MIIGLDLDGVIVDSETSFRVYEEIFAIEDLNNSKIINFEEPKYQERYDWTKEEQDRFNQKYLQKAAKESNFMPGFLTIYNKLKAQGFEFVLITARGRFIEEMKNDAIRFLNDNNIVFDKCFWNVHDKLEICKNENIDVMIDDDHRIIKQLSDAKIHTLYFRDTNLKKLEESDYIHEVNNWGDIYRYFTKESEVKT